MSEYRFYHPIEVRYGDLDPQGHVNNAKFLTYFEQGRVEYLVHLGLFRKNQSFLEIGIILADVHITYHAPLHWGTPAKVGARVVKMGNKSMTMEQNVVNAATGEVLASGTVVLVTYDYRQGKTIPIPADWREKISQFEGLPLEMGAQ